MADFSRTSGTGWDQGVDTVDFSRTTGTGWIEALAGALPVNGSSSGTFDLSGSATGIIYFSLVMGASDGTFDLTGSATGTIAVPASPVIGSSDGTFDLTGAATGLIDSGAFGCSGLPPGWAITREVELLPALDPPPLGVPSFARITYICRDEIGSWVCASGWPEDCCNQAHSVAQSRTQQFPYNEAS